MRYFRKLGLCRMHDMMRLRCENVGAALVNCSEGYSTAKCPSCDKHCKVGGSRTFRCECGYERPRDLKVGKTVLSSRCD